MKKLVLALLLLIPILLNAKEHQVKLLTANSSGQMMIMEPEFLNIEKGDSVRFIPSDASHNVQSLVVPEGGVTFNTRMGESVVIDFDTEGAFLYKCTPHFALGMIGIIQVGRALNLKDVTTQWNTMKSGVVMNQERVASTLTQMTN